jgi:hypothetical protein
MRYLFLLNFFIKLKGNKKSQNKKKIIRVCTCYKYYLKVNMLYFKN